MRSKTTIFPSFEQLYGEVGKSKNEIIQLLPGWIEKLIEGIALLARRKVIRQKNLISLQEELIDWLECHVRNNLELLPYPEPIEKLLRILYEQLITVLIKDIALNPHLLIIPRGYPFEANVSGVEIAVRIVEVNSEGTFIFTQESRSRSVVGATKEKKSLIAQVKSGIGQIAWLQNQLKRLKKTINEILPDEPHAEDVWFVRHAQDLLNYCLSKDVFRSLPLLNDALPQTQLAQNLRLEIITTKACCRDQCRYLFSALRLELHANAINLPIILYADTAYNDGVKYPESDGSIYIINSQGEFVNAETQCLTPKTKQQSILPLENSYLIEIQTKEQKDYSCLVRVGSYVILGLIEAGLSIDGGINPFTYIAPDALIIYMAEKLRARPEIQSTVTKLVNYLDPTLASFNRKALVYWRIGFTDQLHWLLIARRDPQFYKAARENINANRMNFADELYLDDQSEHSKFYHDFVELWRRLEKPVLIYNKMLTFFTEREHIRMPLGCMVGPLSLLMIQNDPFFSDYFRDSLLREQFEEDDENENDAESDEKLAQTMPVLGEEEVLQSAIQASLITEDILTQNPQNEVIFNTWYKNDNIQQLLETVPKNQQINSYVFLNSGEISFAAEFQVICNMARTRRQKVVFITLESTGFGYVNHYLCGYFIPDENMIQKDTLLLINPMGLTQRRDFYQAVGVLQAQNNLQVYLSNNIIQHDPDKLVSCGPLCTEIALHFMYNPFELEMFKLESTVTKENLSCSIIDIRKLLPKSIVELNRSNYKSHLLKIRQKHQDMLRNAPIQTTAKSDENPLQEAVLNVLQAKRKEQELEESQFFQTIIETEEVEILPQPSQSAEKGKNVVLKGAIARLIKDDNFAFTIRHSNRLEMTIAFTATDTILMDLEEIKNHLINLNNLLIEELKSIGLFQNEDYKLKLNWKTMELQIVGDDTSILNRIGILLKNAGEGYWNQAQLRDSNLCFFKPQKEESQSLLDEINTIYTRR